MNVGNTLSNRMEWWANEHCSELMIRFVCNQVETRELDLSGNYFSDRQTAMLFDGLTDDPKTCKVLKKLNLEGSGKFESLETIKQFAQFIFRAPKLENLDLIQMIANRDLAQDMFDRLGSITIFSLKTLDLSNKSSWWNSSLAGQMRRFIS